MRQKKGHPPGPTMHLGRPQWLLGVTCVTRDAPMVKFRADSNVENNNVVDSSCQYQLLLFCLVINFPFLSCAVIAFQTDGRDDESWCKTDMTHQPVASVNVLLFADGHMSADTDTDVQLMHRCIPSNTSHGQLPLNTSQYDPSCWLDVLFVSAFLACVFMFAVITKSVSTSDFYFDFL